MTNNETIDNLIATQPNTVDYPNKIIMPLPEPDSNLDMAEYYVLGARKLMIGTAGRKRALCKAIHYLNNELKEVA